MEKIENLKNTLKKYTKVVVAYSGGVDSSFLLKIAVDALGNKNVLAVTAVSQIYPSDEILKSKKLPESLGVKHIFLETAVLDDENFISNPLDRCFYCKRELFLKITKLQEEFNFNYILDGTNKDDESDFRPGYKAITLFNILTPLKDIGLSKSEIREYAKQIGLSNFNKPGQACLASRIPYGDRITLERLKRIETCEKYLSSLNFKNIRVRDYKNLVRIEVDTEDINIIIKHRLDIIKALKEAGYMYITVDLEGFRSGSMNSVLKTGEEKI
jgi:uncharacterized protein